jgi:hypothetical protein
VRVTAYHRGFDPELDTRPVMHSQYLRPEEEVLFVYGASPANAAYDVRDRQRNGSPKRSAALSALKWTLLALIRLFVKLVRFAMHPYYSSGEVKGVEPVTVSGMQSDCRAATLADAARGRTGVWILTDRRFAFVEVRDRDERAAASASTKEDLDDLKRHIGRLPGEWTDFQQDRQLGPVEAAPVFELTSDQYHDRGRDRRKPKGSKEGVFHLLEFADGSGFALGIDSP